MTTLLQLRTIRPRTSLLNGGGDELRYANTSSLDHGVLSPGKVRRTDLWRSCRAPCLPDVDLDEPSRSLEDPARQDRFRHPCVNRRGFPGPKRLPPTKCSRRFFIGNPPPHLQLCRRRYGFQRSFAPLDAKLLSRREARSTDDYASSSPEVAEDRTPLVDFCNRTRLPSTTARSVEPRSPRSGLPLGSAMSTGGCVPFGTRPAELSRARGLRGQTNPHACTSHRDRSPWELNPNPLKNPDTSCRKLRFGCRLEIPAPGATLVFKVVPACSPG